MWILWVIVRWVLVLMATGVVIYFIWLHGKFNTCKQSWERASRLESYGNLQRTWRVYMKPQFLWWWFRDVKIIKRNTKVHRNKFWSRWNWGTFWIFLDITTTKLYYRCKGNNWLTRRIVDHIRICKDGTIIGKFHIRIFGRLWFLAWFTMEGI